MNIITLYQYHRADGGVTVSPDKPETEYIVAYRLVAADGMMLTNGEIQTGCVDVKDPAGWTETPALPDKELCDPREDVR